MADIPSWARPTSITGSTPTSALARGTQNELRAPGSQTAAGAGRGSYAGYDAKADAASKAKASKPVAAKKVDDTKKPPTEPKLGQRESASLVFPEDIGAYTMLMSFGPYRRQVALEDAKVDHDTFIMLPVPTNIGEAFKSNYNNVSLGPFLGPLLGLGSGILTDAQAGKDISKSATDRIANGLRNPDNAYTFMTTAAHKAASGLGEPFAAGVDMAFGMVPNPNLAMAFQSVSLRNFSFSWRLAPRSPKESQTAMDIVRQLKLKMLPEKTGLALRYPDFCDITLQSAGKGGLNNLIKFKTSVITDVRVNYAPSGIPSFFAGTQLPTEIDIAIAFQETKMFTRSDFETKPVAASAGASDSYF